MATIISFQPRHTSDRAPAMAGETASILLFTGVRYERREQSVIAGVDHHDETRGGIVRTQ